jgi:hypothetical protein
MLLKSRQAPSLAKLTVATSEKLGTIPPEPAQFDTLYNLRRLHLRMPAWWFLPILIALPARERILTLIVEPTLSEYEGINHRTLRERFFRSPMQFEGLQNLRYNFPKCDDYRAPGQWFLSTFDFSSARNYVEPISYGEVRLCFPNAKKLSLEGVGTTIEIEAPRLEHLLLPLLSEPIGLLVPTCGLSTMPFRHLDHIFVNVKTLELASDGCGVLTPGDLIPFPNVKTLILKGFSTTRDPERRLFHWVSDEAPGGGSYLPQLSELVIKANIPGHPYKIILEITRDFLIRRQEMSPIDILTVPPIPHCLRGDPVLKWFRENQSFSLKTSTGYFNEFD